MNAPAHVPITTEAMMAMLRSGFRQRFRQDNILIYDLRFTIYDLRFTILDFGFFDWNWVEFDNLVSNFKNLNENDRNRIEKTL